MRARREGGQVEGLGGSKAHYGVGGRAIGGAREAGREGGGGWGGGGEVWGKGHRLSVF